MKEGCAVYCTAVPMGGMGAEGFLALHFAHTLIHAALYVPVIDVVVLGGSSLIASVALGENLISIWQK